MGCTELRWDCLVELISEGGPICTMFSSGKVDLMFLVAYDVLDS